jgi:hypothetical protein
MRCVCLCPANPAAACTHASGPCWQSERPYLFAVEDPNDPSNDLGRNSYNISRVRGNAFAAVAVSRRMAAWACVMCACVRAWAAHLPRVVARGAGLCLD